MNARSFATRRAPRRRFVSGIDGARSFPEYSSNDPLAGLANLVDLMLVFACGLLIALFLSLDMADLLRLPEEERAAAFEALRDAQELETLETRQQPVSQSEIQSAGQYRSVGVVYRDTLTGRMFVIENGRR